MCGTRALVRMHTSIPYSEELQLNVVENRASDIGHQNLEIWDEAGINILGDLFVVGSAHHSTSCQRKEG